MDQAIDPCELSFGHGNLISGSLEEQSVFVTAEPSLQLLNWLFFYTPDLPTYLLTYLGKVLHRVGWDILHQSPIETTSTGMATRLSHSFYGTSK
jgi:hypothetical protein